MEQNIFGFGFWPVISGNTLLFGMLKMLALINTGRWRNCFSNSIISTLIKEQNNWLLHVLSNNSIHYAYEYVPLKILVPIEYSYKTVKIIIFLFYMWNYRKYFEHVSGIYHTVILPSPGIFHTVILTFPVICHNVILTSPGMCHNVIFAYTRITLPSPGIYILIWY